MNIFVLDLDPQLCAQYHSNKHTIKMILETAQLLCTAQRSWGIDWGYKSTHLNHPCSVWTRQNQFNFIWLQKLGLELCKEYTFRYGKVHKSQEVIESCWPLACSYLYPRLDRMTPFPLCMPDDCKIANDPVASYRKYYLTYKQHLLQYKVRQPPHWLQQKG